MTTRLAQPSVSGRLSSRVAPLDDEWPSGDAAGLDRPPGATGAAEAQLSAALPLPWWSSMLPRPLERRFAAEWAARQAPWFLPLTVIGVLAFLALAAGDSTISTRAAATLDALRSWIVGVTAVYLAVRELSRWRRWRIPPVVWSICYAAGSTAMAVYTAMLNRAAPTDIEGVKCSALLLIFLSTTLVARLPLSLCLLSGVTSVGVYAALVGPVVGAGDVVFGNNMQLFTMSFAFIVVVRWSLDRSQRTAWVLRELDAVRRADLAAGSEVLRQLVLRDPLTGLGNRRQLEESVGGDQLSGKPLLVLTVDIDDFKAYNDSYGHLGGDVCLRTVAEALQDVARCRAGVATRVGGEEFTLLLPDSGHSMGISTARAAAEDVCAAVRALRLPHTASRCSDVVTVSVGVATLGAERGDARSVEVSDALLAADQALYHAKEAGRDRWAAAPSTEPTQDVPAVTRTQTVSADRPDATTAGAAGAEQATGRLTPQAAEQYWAQSPALRPRRVSALAIGFAPVVVLYSAVSARLFPDIATAIVISAAVVQMLTVVWFSLTPRLQLPWRWRVGPLAASVTAMGCVILSSAHESRAPLAMVPLLSLVLLPMFLAFVVGVPFRTVATVCVLLFAGLLAVTQPWAVSQTSMAANVVKTDLFAGLYALLGTHLLQRSRYLEFSLGLREAELAAALQAQRAELEGLATRDPLTGLTNRRAFESCLATAHRDAAAVGAPVALLLLDVDHFKRYNDSAGHPAGDEVLRRLGAALAAWAVASCDALPLWKGQPAALASRWGGEEFGVLLPGIAEADAMVMAEQVRAAVAGLGLSHPDSPVAPQVTASIGVAVVSCADDGQTAAEARTRLLTMADEALYRAKANGRDRVAS